MPALPTGTVTLLFTDIEGSTRLLEELGAQRYGELLAEHHRVCREVWAGHGGTEVDTAGDAFFVAFATASEAVLAAQAAQAALTELGLRVRMGVHTGEVMLADTGYVGLEVHRSARIAAAANGGQVLVSSATAAMLAGGALALRDLGEHRFKDLGEPERVFQLGGVDFPPIRSLYRSNLPVPGSAFLGREAELGEIVALLLREGVRLVTLTGPGGTGKTRLALQAAAEASHAFPDGVWWIPLAPVRDPDAVLPLLARTLDLREQADRDLADVLGARLAGKRALLVLDNAEHLLPELAATIGRLRAIAPVATVLVTSRERLQLSGEEVWRVPALADEEGVELFLARARALGAAVEDTPVVRELCARLDSLPLALELAAARAVIFSPQQLVERLGQRLDLLKGGRDADPRQQTLRATIDWSYQLLSAEEQRVFCGLSAFRGGCSYEGAAEVAEADPDLLQSLLDKSLIRRSESESGPRYSLLETMREYAAEQLEAAAFAPGVWLRFDRFAATYATTLGEAFLASGMNAAIAGYADERANLWLAIERSRSAPAALARFVIGLYNLWADHGEFAASRDVAEAVLARLEELEPSLQGAFLVAAATTLGDGGDSASAAALAQRAIPLLEQNGDPLWLGRALCCAGTGEMNLVAPAPSPEARRMLQRASELSRATGDEVYLAVELVNRAELAERDGDSGSALALLAEVAVIGERLEHSLIRNQALWQQAALARNRGEPERCEQFVREALDVDRTRPPEPLSLLMLMDELIHVSAGRGDAERAARLVGACETLMESAGMSGDWAETLAGHYARLREGGSDGAVERAHRAGREMSTAALIDYASA